MNMNRLLKFCSLGIGISAFLFIACTGTLPTTKIHGPSTYHQKLDLVTGGYQRSYRVHVPTGFDHAHKLPLVVVIHGAFDTAKNMEKVSGFSRIADKEGFIVLYPEGIGILGFLQHWNAGHCCGRAAKKQIDDVGYLKTTIEDVCMRLPVDSSRVYMVGFSNGGMMTYRFAAEHTDMLAAAAPIAASIGGRPTPDVPLWRTREPKNPLPIMIIHGLNDEDIPFEGGRSSHRKGERTYVAVEDSVRLWIEANGCEDAPVDSHLASGAVHLREWNTCSNASVTILCTIDNWGHTWPGHYYTSKLQVDDPLFNFDLAEVIWNFFKKHP